MWRRRKDKEIPVNCGEYCTHFCLSTAWTSAELYMGYIQWKRIEPRDTLVWLRFEPFSEKSVRQWTPAMVGLDTADNRQTRIRTARDPLKTRLWFIHGDSRILIKGLLRDEQLGAMTRSVPQSGHGLLGADGARIHNAAHGPRMKSCINYMQSLDFEKETGLWKKHIFRFADELSS